MAAAAAAAFLCLLDVTKIELCINEQRHRGPLGPMKYKYFNNKHVHCLPPVTTPGYYFTLNAESRCWILQAYTVQWMFSPFPGRDFHVESFSC